MVVQSDSPSLRFSTRRNNAGQKSWQSEPYPSLSTTRDKYLPVKNDNIDLHKSVPTRSHSFIADAQTAPLSSQTPTHRELRSFKQNLSLFGTPHRPVKRAKLDDRRNHGPASAVPATLPLRSRDVQRQRSPCLDSAKEKKAPTTNSIRTTRRAAAVAPAELTKGPNSADSVAPPAVVTRTTRRNSTWAVAENEAEGDRARRSQLAPQLGWKKNNKVDMSKPKGGTDATPRTTSVTSGNIGKRSLRSHDGGSRSKTELAMYFSNYDELITLNPPKPEFLSPDTTISFIHDLTEPLVLEPEVPTSSANPNCSKNGKYKQNCSSASTPFQPGRSNPLVNLHDAQVIKLPTLESGQVLDVTDDPLTDDVYFRAHRRIERQEKQLRNIEKEHAQHEKVQLERLLDELKGSDWLRTMGISGITESEKKLYEPKRKYFIKEVASLLEKFRVWKEEEKRRKLEREVVLADEEEEEEDATADEEVNPTGSENQEGDEEDDQQEENDVQSEESVKDIGHLSNGDGLPSLKPFADINDVDACAALQLHQEAMSASRRLPTTKKGQNTRKPPKLPDPKSKSKVPTQPNTLSSTATRRTQPPPLRSPLPISEPELDPGAPFTSFYTKPHLRDAAVGKIRRAGRTRTAFGAPVPDVEESEFRLPADILTPDAIVASRRKRRRLRREEKS